MTAKKFKRGQRVRFRISAIQMATDPKNKSLKQNRKTSVAVGKIVGFLNAGGETKLKIQIGGRRGPVMPVHPSQVVD